MKAHISTRGKLLGGYVPDGVIDGIRQWITKDPERDISTFIRQAAREKLTRDGIRFTETCTVKEAA